MRVCVRLVVVVVSVVLLSCPVSPCWVGWMDGPLFVAAVARVSREPSTSAGFALVEMRRLEDEAASVGARVEWSLDGCEPSAGAAWRTFGRFCASTPDVVYLNGSSRLFASSLRSGAVASTLRHELAHRAVWLMCGTLSPRVARGRGEALANAYAIRFYGADHDLLMAGRPAGYRVTPADYVAAQSVHDGDCG